MLGFGCTEGTGVLATPDTTLHTLRGSLEAL